MEAIIIEPSNWMTFSIKEVICIKLHFPFALSSCLSDLLSELCDLLALDCGICFVSLFSVGDVGLIIGEHSGLNIIKNKILINTKVHSLSDFFELYMRNLEAKKEEIIPIPIASR
jgi:hypothetical protein